ncbi:hypothetical protein XENOCAPTIV_013326, partial [Xenoophorus captivus]
CSEVFADGNVASGLYVIRPDGAPTALNVYCDMSNGCTFLFPTLADRCLCAGPGWSTAMGLEISSPLKENSGWETTLCTTSPHKDQYQLHVGDYTGNAGDALADARGLNFNSPCKGGIKFSTYDHPNDMNATGDNGRCIRHSKSGWWCDSGKLNGQEFKGPFQAMSDDGVAWYVWHGWSYAIKSVVMMVRAADLENPPAIIERFSPNMVEGGQ